MQVKKFEASNMREALNVIKREMGPDAIILQTKENRKGFGLMSRESVEVTAAISREDLKKKKNLEKHLTEEDKEKIWTSTVTDQKKIYGDYFGKELSRTKGARVQISGKAREKSEKIRAQPNSGIGEGSTTSAQSPTNVLKQIPMDILSKFESEMTKSQSPPRDTGREDDLRQQVSDLTDMVKHMATSQSLAQRKASISDEGYSDEMLDAFYQLVSMGVSKHNARDLIKSSGFELSISEQEDPAKIQDIIAQVMMEKIEVEDLLKDVGASSGVSEPTHFAMVGPTGVGKTTTIAKIASQAIQKKNLRVGLINLDSYKVGAVEHLGTYARIMNAPYRNVSNKEEFLEALYDFGSLDLILIDTAGRSQRDQENLSELNETLSGVKDLKSVLVISATTKNADVSDIVQRFGILKPKGLIFSKLDETAVHGLIYNTQLSTGLPLSYFTVGQRVPEDIESATSERVVDLILHL